VDKNDYSILISDYNIPGKLYYCSASTGADEKVECAEVTDIGYFAVDKDTVYTCQDDGEGQYCTRGKVTLTTCSSTSSIGKLFMAAQATSISFCLNYDPSLEENKRSSIVELNGSKNGNFLVYRNSDPKANVFGMSSTNENYAIVNVQDGKVLLNNTYDNGLKYTYVNIEKNEVMVKGDKTTYPIVSGSSELNENMVLELICDGGKCMSSESVITFDDADGRVENFIFSWNYWYKELIISFYNFFNSIFKYLNNFSLLRSFVLPFIFFYY